MMEALRKMMTKVRVIPQLDKRRLNIMDPFRVFEIQAMQRTLVLNTVKSQCDAIGEAVISRKGAKENTKILRRSLRLCVRGFLQSLSISGQRAAPRGKPVASDIN